MPTSRVTFPLMSRASLGAVFLCLLIPCSTPAHARTLELEKGAVRRIGGEGGPRPGGPRPARRLTYRRGFPQTALLHGAAASPASPSAPAASGAVAVRACGWCSTAPRRAAGGAGPPVAPGGPRLTAWRRASQAARGPGQPAPHPTLPPAAAGRLRGRDGAGATRVLANAAAGARSAGQGGAAAARPAPGRLPTTRCSRRPGRPIRWCWTWAAPTTTSMPSRPASGSRCCGRAIS